MISNIADPGLFDAPLPQSSSSPRADTSTGMRANIRRVYRPVPEEKRKSKEYRVSRERNNRAVQRCRANNKFKQDCLAIKSEGYRALAEEYLKAARQLMAERKDLLRLFVNADLPWQRLEELFRLRMTTGQDSGHIQILLNREAAARVDFEEHVEVVRQQYAGRVQTIIEGR